MLEAEVSGSVDREEYRIQVERLAAGLRDGAAGAALAVGEAALLLMQ